MRSLLESIDCSSLTAMRATAQLPSRISARRRRLSLSACQPTHPIYSSRLTSPASISALARSRIHHISKETFLPAFKSTYDKIFTPANIRAGFRGARLAPHDPEVVLSKLNMRLRTPTPPQQDNVAWEAQTPRNAREIEAQSTLIRQRVQNRAGSLASSLDEKIRQLSKGAQEIAHNMVLM
jgi:hypothetical protein